MWGKVAYKHVTTDFINDIIRERNSIFRVLRGDNFGQRLLKLKQKKNYRCNMRKK